MRSKLFALFAASGLLACSSSPSVQSTATSTSSSSSSSGQGGSGSGGDGGGGQGGQGGQGNPLPGGVYAIDGTKLGTPTDDLAPFGALVGDTPLVGIGESIHTSGGYLDMKTRLIQYLIQDKGFRVLTMETPRSAARSVEAYITTCKGTPKEALTGIFGVFANQSTADLAAWLCQWNQAHPADQVHFYGFDAQQPEADVAELHAFLTAAAPADAASLEAGLATCNAKYDVMATYSSDDFMACNAGLDALDAYVKAHTPELTAASSAESVVWATLNSVSYRSWQAEDFYYLTDLATSYEARDLAMAAIEEATRTLKFPNQKAVVWAHNYHLTRNHTEVSELGLGMTNTMGSVLSKDLGASYKAFALIGYDVEINWPGVGMGQTTPPTKKALESTLHALGRDTLFLDFMTPAIAPLVPMDKEILFNAPSEIKAIGPHQFDGAFFLDKSPPMDALYW